MVTQICGEQFPADDSFDEMQTIELPLDLSKGINILSTECCSSSHRGGLVLVRLAQGNRVLYQHRRIRVYLS
jgi:hypothetical protein